MSASGLRSILAAILAVTIVVKVHAAVVPQIDMPATISKILANRGFSPDSGSKAAPFLSFSVPGCRLPLRVTTISLYLGESLIFDREVRPDYIHRFIYLGREWGHPDRFAMRKEWLKYRVLALLGISPYVPMPIALRVDQPIDCQAAAAVQWPLVWTEKFNTDPISEIQASAASN
jgi:hypothetical protein